MNLPKYSKGFTIVELLVSMSVIAIIAGGIIPTFSTYVRNQNLKQAQEQIKSDLRSIQNRALTGAFSDQTLRDDGGVEWPILYWGVRFRNGSSDYHSFTSSFAVACPPFPMDQQASYSIPNEIKYFGLTELCLFFSIKNGDVIEVPNNPNDYIEVRNSETDTNYKRIFYNNAGLIWTEN